MYGALLGDIIGSPYEFDRSPKTKVFPLFGSSSHFTDDSVMTVAVADALIQSRDMSDEVIKNSVVWSMQNWGRKYPDAGYGGRFGKWLKTSDPAPYGSYGNGSAMRVSSVGWLYDSLERTRHVAALTAEVTHNHPEGIKGAESVASAIFMARTGCTKEQIRDYITKEFGYDLERTCDMIRPSYHHVESSPETVPEAVISFLEGTDFIDVIRNAVSLGGDCDTLTCIAASIAEAYYGIPDELIRECAERIAPEMCDVIQKFDEIRIPSVADSNRNNGSGLYESSISFEIGDITKLETDAIVNAANTTLLGGSGVDGAIHRAAGPKLLEECRTLNGCKTGEAKITKGYDLRARYVIHTVGPVYSGSAEDEKLLYSCYTSSLDLAKKNNIHSIAFPCISTGIYGYPREEAARISLKAIADWLDANSSFGMKVIICCFDYAAFGVYQSIIN